MASLNMSSKARPSVWRLTLAFLIAPAVPAAILAAIYWSDTPSEASYIDRFRMVAIIGAYPPALAIGVPALLILRNRVEPSVLILAVIGGVIAAVPWLLLLPLGWHSSFDIIGYLMESVLPSFVLGLLGGAIFYLIGIAGGSNTQSSFPLAT